MRTFRVVSGMIFGRRMPSILCEGEGKHGEVWVWCGNERIAKEVRDALTEREVEIEAARIARGVVS